MILDQPDLPDKSPHSKGVILWMGISFLLAIGSTLWLYIGTEFATVFIVGTVSWLSSLVAVGYYSTPSGSWQGKLAFCGVCVMVAGILFKVLHLPGGNALIVAGLVVTSVSYVLHWTNKTDT